MISKIRKQASNGLEYFDDRDKSRLDYVIKRMGGAIDSNGNKLQKIQDTKLKI